MKNRILVSLLAAFMVLSCLAASVPAFADVQVGTENDASAADPEDVDPLSIRYENALPVAGEKQSGKGMPASLQNLVNLKVDDSRFEGVPQRYGIDVSKWDNYASGNKEEAIDWDKVKSSGIDFVFVRMGYRTLRQSGGIYADPWGKRNLEGALRAGLRTGVYIYSQALNESEAEEEAKWLLNAVGDLKSQLTLPFVFDYEYGEYYLNGKLTWGRFNAGAISKAQKTKNALAFLRTIEKAGCEPMFYANKDMMENDLDMSQIDQRYKVWLARYISNKIKSADYKGNYSFWQIAEADSVEGIPAPKMDFDIWYDMDGFIDVPTQSYYAEPVRWAVNHKITSGVSSFAFGPADPCTRAQIVSFLYRMTGEPPVESDTAHFDDVASAAWYAPAVRWAADAGITSGTSATTFSPAASCTRGQAITFIWKAMGMPEAGDNPIQFEDVTDSYYTTALAWATTHGVVSGTSATTFSPYQRCTRAQIVTMLYNAYREHLTEEDTDSTQ